MSPRLGDSWANSRSILEAITGFSAWQEEFRVITIGGQAKRLLATANPRREESATVWAGIFTDVTEQRRIERELEESHRKLEEITASMPGAVYQYIVRPDGTDAFLFFSAGLDDVFGVPGQKMIEDAGNAWSVVHPEDLPEVKASAFRSAMTLEPWECEYRLQLPERGERWVQGRSMPRREPDGTVIWDGFFSDVTERKRIEAERNAAQATLAKVTNAVPGAFYQYARRPDGSEHFPFFTSGMDEVLGFPATRIVENLQAYVKIIHPEDLPRVQAASAHSTATLSPWDLEYRIVPRPGEVRWVHGRSKPRHEPDGTIIWDGFISDVTERKRIEAERNSAQRKLAEITAGMPGAVFQYHQSPTGDRSIPFVSEGVERLFGVSATEIMANGLTLWRYCQPEEIREAFRLTEHSRETLAPFDFTYHVALPDGLKWVRAQSVPHRSPDGGTVWSGLLTDVTEQKLTELARAEAERKLTEIAAAMPGAVYQYLKTPGGHYRFTFVSEGATTLFDIPSPVSIEDMNRTFHGGLIRELTEEAFRLIDVSAETLTPYQQEFPILLQNGSKKWIRAESLPRRLPNGAVQWSGLMLDISERKRAEAARAEAEAKLGEITAAMPGAVYQYVKTPGGHYRFTFVSEGGAALLGVPSPVRAEDVNRVFQVGLPRDLSEAGFRLIDHSAETMTPCCQEFPLTLADGTMKWIRAESLPRRLPNGGVQWSGLILDISERKRAEAARAEAEAKLGEIADAVPGTVYQYVRYPDGREKFEFASSGLESILGVSPEALKENPTRLFERIHPEDLPVSLAETLRVERELDSFDLEYRVRDDSGPDAWKWVRVQAVTHRRADGATVWTGLMTDIGDYKTLEASLRASEERFATIFRSSPVACVVTRLGDEGRIAAVNQAFTRLFGLDVEAVIGRTSIELGLTRDFVKRDAMREAVLAGLTPSVAESEMRASGGEMRKLLFAAERVVYDGEVCALTMIVDLTDRVRLEDERLRAGKLESLGVMAGGIAHDFNNLLTAMSGNAGLARHYLKNGAAAAKIQEKIESLERAVERAKTLSNQLLTFAKGGDPVRRTVDPIVFVVDPVRFILTPTATTCRFDAPSGLWQVKADVGQMSQVFQNLAVNATEAMSGGGTVEVTIENVRVDLSLPLPLAPGKYVRVVFTDTGCGIPADRLAKIFDPYFTTKPTGTGLGLAVAHSVVMKHDGYITAQSEVGQGSRFEIYLPARETGSLTQEVPVLTPDDARRAAERRILIMDDEDLVREMMAAMIEDIGYACVACRNGEEAVEAYRAAFEQGTPFALVMLDLKIMGGMGGLETFEHLRRIDPAVTAIVCSGYFSDPVLAHHQEHGFAAKLQKPYRLDDLRVLLEKIFGER